MRVPGLSAMYSRARVAAWRSTGSAKELGSGTRSGNVRHHAGVGAPSDLRRNLGGVEGDDLVVSCARVRGKGLPALHRGVKILAARNKGAAFHIGKRGIVRRHHAGARAAFNRHVANRHAAFHGEAANRLAPEFDDVAVAAGDANLADDGQNDVLGGDARSRGGRQRAPTWFWT